MLVSHRSILALALAPALLACAAHSAPAPEPRGFNHLRGARLAPSAPVPPDDGQWVMPAHDYASTRFSALEQINVANAPTLRLAWEASTDTLRGNEAAPLVVGDTMYVVTPYPNNLYAFDLNHPGPTPKWVYRPPTLPASQGVACCDVVNRGAAFAGGRVYYNTLDVQTVAVDAASGREVWRTRLGDINRGETITMAPLVVRDRVLVGNSGGEMGVRGWLTALDANTGQIAWRAYNTGTDRDVRIGPAFQPFYPQYRGTDLGATSWPPGRWETGGASVWGWISYDPALDLIYYGTGNPSPWNPEQRPGDNLWSSGLFARRPETGEAVWFYQSNPHDLHDYDDVNESVLIDLVLGGATRHVLVRPGRNGYVYVLDRTTGEVLSVAPFVHVTSSMGVDERTGRPILNTAKTTGVGHIVRDVCPAAPGGKDWQPSAFSPRTGLLYIPHQNLCEDEEGLDVGYIAGTPYVGANTRMYAGPGGQRGRFTAWDPIAARPVWQLSEPFPVWSGAVVTAGDVVFYGTMDGWFKAVNARTGALLWRYHTPSGIVGQPITYRGPDGRQYVAVLSGVGGWSGAIVAAGLDPTDQTAALGFVNAMADLPSHTRRGGMVHVFALP